jgi:hypothetical protein
MEYLEWNDRLAQHFFHSENAGRRVYLYATRELVERIGQQSGAGFQDFVEAVKRGPEWVHRAGLCQRILESLKDWRSRGLAYPPYIGSLSLFVIAAGIEGDFEPHEYYGRLWNLLGIDDSGTPPSFDKMLYVWSDLETWSVTDRRGELGIFRADPIGKWIHVGVPFAQTLFSEHERHVLPRIFASAALGPTAPPASQEMESLLRSYDKGAFRAKTLRVLGGGDAEQQEIKRALLQSVISELRAWDGIVPTAEGETGSGGVSNWPLRLCCELDQTARRAVMSLRCKAPKEFPEAGFTLFVTREEPATAAGGSEKFTCEEDQFGWSTALEDEGGHSVNAARFDWCAGLELQDESGLWKCRLSPSPARVFVDGSTEGLGVLVEIRSLPVNRPFHIAAAPGACEFVEKWGSSSCDGWRELDSLRGLPTGWRFFLAKRARSDELIRSKYPNLSLPAFVTVIPHGGIRISRADRYFNFAPPVIEVQGEIDKLTFNGEASLPRTADGLYEIPQSRRALRDDDPDKIKIEAWRGERVIDQRAIFVSEEGWSWVDRTVGLRLDAFGEQVSGEADQLVCGSRISGFDVPAFQFGGVVPLTADGSVHYIGREPGQIIHWPNEQLSRAWVPVWVVISRRAGEVIFCGGDIADCEPVLRKAQDRRKVKAWREYVWVRRKKLKIPANPAVRALWKRYQAVAENA